MSTKYLYEFNGVAFEPNLAYAKFKIIDPASKDRIILDLDDKHRGQEIIEDLSAIGLDVKTFWGDDCICLEDYQSAKTLLDYFIDHYPTGYYRSIKLIISQFFDMVDRHNRRLKRTRTNYPPVKNITIWDRLNYSYHYAYGYYSIGNFRSSSHIRFKVHAKRSGDKINEKLIANDMEIINKDAHYNVIRDEHNEVWLYVFDNTTASRLIMLNDNLMPGEKEVLVDQIKNFFYLMHPDENPKNLEAYEHECKAKQSIFQNAIKCAGTCMIEKPKLKHSYRLNQCRRWESDLITAALFSITDTDDISDDLMLREDCRKIGLTYGDDYIVCMPKAMKGNGSTYIQYTLAVLNEGAAHAIIDASYTDHHQANIDSHRVTKFFKSLEDR